MGTGRPKWLAGLAVAATLLIAGGLALFVAQDRARDGLIERFEQRPAGTVAFLRSALESSKESGAQIAGETLAKPHITRDDLLRYAEGGQRRPGDLLLVLSERGRLLVSAGRVARLRLRELLRRADVRAGLAGQFRTSGPMRGAGGDLVLGFVTPFEADGDRRILVEELPVEVAGFIDSALPSVPGPGGDAYVLGTQGRVLAATDGTGKGARVPSRALTEALARETAGTYSHAGEDRRFVARRVPHSDWRLVVTVPEDRLLSSVDGLNRWVPWGLFLGFLLTMIAALVFWRRAERTATSLADRERRYRALVEGVPGIVYITEFGENASILYASRRVETILGYTPEEWMAGQDLWAELLMPADRSRAVADRERAEITGQPLRCEYRMLARDGRIVWFRDEAVVLEEESRRVLQGVMYDITGLKQAEERVRSYNRELESTVEERTRELHASRVEVLQRLSLAAEYRDDATLEHTERVGRTAALIAEQMGLEDELVLRIRHAAPLHDVGKLSTSDSILLKREELTDEEFERVKTHTTIGAKILAGSTSDTLQLAREIALSHHERWDGSGYPQGLSGEQIPVAGRIVAVADVFDALSHARPYKEAWPVEEAVAEILSGSGTQFDPAVVEAFAALDHNMLTGPLTRRSGVGARP